MKHISIIVPAGISVVDTIIAPYNLLKMANTRYMQLKGLKERPYRIDLVGLSKEPVIYQGIFSVSPSATIDEIEKTDLIVVSPISGNLAKQIDLNTDFVQWIKQQRISHGADIASLCKGAFLLAETGLLNGKDCATHWTAHNEFRARYPKVNLVPDKIICEDNGIFSSGGAYSILNFTLYLIERLFGRQTAIWCSKISEIEFDRISQNKFIIFSGQKDHQDQPIKQAQQYIEQHFEEKININQLAARVHLNSRSFLRRFKKATSNTPIEYIQRVKIEAAKKRLESSTETVSQVMYSLGYNDEKAFRTVFKKHAGLSPNQYRTKFNREMAIGL